MTVFLASFDSQTCTSWFAVMFLGQRVFWSGILVDICSRIVGNLGVDRAGGNLFFYFYWTYAPGAQWQQMSQNTKFSMNKMEDLFGSCLRRPRSIFADFFVMPTCARISLPLPGTDSIKRQSNQELLGNFHGLCWLLTCCVKIMAAGSCIKLSYRRRVAKSTNDRFFQYCLQTRLKNQPYFNHLRFQVKNMRKRKQGSSVDLNRASCGQSFIIFYPNSLDCSQKVGGLPIFWNSLGTFSRPICITKQRRRHRRFQKTNVAYRNRNIQLSVSSLGVVYGPEQVEDSGNFNEKWWASCFWPWQLKMYDLWTAAISRMELSWWEWVVLHVLGSWRRRIGTWMALSLKWGRGMQIMQIYISLKVCNS